MLTRTRMMNTVSTVAFLLSNTAMRIILHEITDWFSPTRPLWSARKLALQLCVPSLLVAVDPLWGGLVSDLFQT